MPRPLRENVPGGIYHVTTHAISEIPLYRVETDFALALRLFARAVKRYGWICLSYCLMTNHAHFLFETPQPNLSVGMQWLNGRYAMFFNQTQGRLGHVHRSRFASSLVETDSHLLAATRYIPLNPVRAGLCHFPEDWRWSSHRAMVGLEEPSEFLATRRVLALFDDDASRARTRFRDFVLAGLAELSDQATSGV